MKRVSLLSSLVMIMVSNGAFAGDGYSNYHQGNYKEAKPRLVSLAKRGDKQALFYLGLMKIHGYAMPKDVEAGLTDIERSAKSGFLQARLYMGKLRLSQNEPTKAFYWYKLAADKGDVSAQLYTASSYKFGFGTKANATLSRRYLSRAANNGSSLAQYYLAEGYLKSSRKGTRRMGFNWLKKSARGGCVLAEIALSELYAEGRRVAYSPMEASFWLDKAKKNKEINTDIIIGDYYSKSYDLSEREKAIKWYKKSEKNSPLAKYKLGKIYLENNFHQGSITDGLKLIETAANLGSAQAERTLADFYKHGNYLEKSDTKSMYWMKKAEKNPESSKKHQMLSWISYDFQDKDIIKKFTPKQVLPKLANESATKKGSIVLGPKSHTLEKKDVYESTLELVMPDELDLLTLIESVKPVKGMATVSNRPFPFYPLKNKKPGQNYFNKLYSKALLGNREAQFELAQYYHFGIGVKKNVPTALTWYYKAAMQHHMGSEYGLGLIYLQGDGVAQNLGSAKAWLELSSFKGNPYAQYALAYAHQQGLGEPYSEEYIQKDTERAKSLYHLASSMDIADAEYNLANLYATEDLSKLSALDKKERVETLKALYEGAYNSGINQAKEPLAFYYLAGNAPSDKLKWSYQKIREKAEQGDPQYALLLAVMFDRGLGVTQDKGAAKSWYKVAANQSNPIAQFALGTYYYKEGYNSEEKELGRKLIGQSSYNDFSPASYNLAVVFKEMNLDYLGLLNQSAANKFDKGSLYLSDQDLLNGSTNLTNARETYLKLSKQNNATASLKFAYMLEKGLGGRTNLKLARQYYQKAASLGNAKAQYLLAEMYQYGKGIKSNQTKALYWYKKSAAQGLEKAYLALGFLYETEFNNFEQAKHWYEKALINDRGKANFNLALFYEYGKGGVSVDRKRAFDYLYQAANEQEKNAYFPLAMKYYLGEGTDKQDNQAYQWFLKAEKAGEIRAVEQLAKMNEFGIGTVKSIPLAIHYYQILASQGNIEAIVSIAKLYQANKELDKAFNYYQKAATKGNKFARYQVAKMRLEGEGVAVDKDRAIKELKALKKQNYQKASLLLEQIVPVKEEKDT